MGREVCSREGSTEASTALMSCKSLEPRALRDGQCLSQDSLEFLGTD